MSNTIQDTLRGWAPVGIDLLCRLVAAALIFFVGTRVVKVVHKILKKMFERTELDLSMARFLISVSDAAIYTLTIFIAADKLGIPSASIITLVGSAGIAIGLSLQNSLSNVAGGILLMLIRPFVVNDYIVCGGFEGRVQNVGLVYTTLLTPDNKKITIPNSTLSNDKIVNVTAQEKRRVDVEVGISYSSDIKLAKDIIQSVFESHPLVLREDGVTVYVSELAHSAVIIGGRGWAKTADYWEVRWDIIESVKEEFDKWGIQIPFNQMDVNIRQGTEPAAR